MQYLLIFLLLTSACFAGEPDIPLHNRCIYPSVIIEPEESGLSMGSGVVIKSIYHEKQKHWLNTVLSCAHIIEKPIAPKVRSKYKLKVGNYKNWSQLVDYTPYDVHIRRIDYDLDICVINYWSKTEQKTAELDRSPNLYIGNDIFRVGCGLQEEMRLDYGKVTSLNSQLQPGRLRTSIFCLPGDSGGPIYHNYKLVGIVQSIRYMHTDENVRVPVPHISYIVPLKFFTENDLTAPYP